MGEGSPPTDPSQPSTSAQSAEPPKPPSALLRQTEVSTTDNLRPITEDRRSPTLRPSGNRHPLEALHDWWTRQEQPTRIALGIAAAVTPVLLGLAAAIFSMTPLKVGFGICYVIVCGSLVVALWGILRAHPKRKAVTILAIVVFVVGAGASWRFSRREGPEVSAIPSPAPTAESMYGYLSLDCRNGYWGGPASAIFYTSVSGDLKRLPEGLMPDGASRPILPFEKAYPSSAFITCILTNKDTKPASGAHLHFLYGLQTLPVRRPASMGMNYGNTIDLGTLQPNAPYTIRYLASEPNTQFAIEPLETCGNVTLPDDLNRSVPCRLYNWGQPGGQVYETGTPPLYIASPYRPRLDCHGPTAGEMAPSCFGKKPHK